MWPHRLPDALQMCCSHPHLRAFLLPIPQLEIVSPKTSHGFLPHFLQVFTQMSPFQGVFLSFYWQLQPLHCTPLSAFSAFSLSLPNTFHYEIHYVLYLFSVTFHPNVSSIRAGLAQTSGLTGLLWSLPTGAESGSGEPWAWGCQLQQRCRWLSSAREHQSLPPGTRQVWTVALLTGHLGWGRLRGSYSTLLVHHKHERGGAGGERERRVGWGGERREERGRDGGGERGRWGRARERGSRRRDGERQEVRGERGERGEGEGKGGKEGGGGKGKRERV